MSSKQLPVVLADNFQVGFFYYFPLSCALTNDEYKDWYYMNYIDIIGAAREVVRADQTYINYDLRYPDGESYFSRRVSSNSIIMFDEYDLDLVNLKSGIIDFIKKNINMEKYLIVYVNVMRLLNSQINDIVIHDVFVYGYDDVTQMIDVGCMINKEYRLFQVSYNAMEKGFNDYLNYLFTVRDKKRLLITFYLTNSITALDPNDVHCFLKPKYDINIVLEKIELYLNAKVSSGNMIISDGQKVKKLYCGIDSYNLFQDYLHELMQGLVQTTSYGANNFDLYDFMFPFYYTNHKKGIFDRLNYAYSMTGKEIYQKVAKEYEYVVKAMELIKNKHMKLCMGNKILTTVIYDEFNIMLEDVRKKEKTILAGIL